MKRIMLLIAIACHTTLSMAADIRYVSDKQYVPLRSGPNNTYRIIHRGIPTGTEMTVLESNKETGYSRIRTAKGTEGWILLQYLMKQKPAVMKLGKIEQDNTQLSKQKNDLSQKIRGLNKDNQVMKEQLIESQSRLRSTAAKLSEIKRVSENALTLDKNNRKLTRDNELLKSQLELVDADNDRLRKSEQNEAFLNGALAVLIGVMLTLLIPRVWPKKRQNSEWA